MSFLMPLVIKIQTRNRVDDMKWNEKNKAKIYAALHKKLQTIRDEVHKKLQTIRDEVPKPKLISSQDKYNDFLDSCGILRVTTALYSGPEFVKEIGSLWITESKKLAETENNIIIPNPLFSKSYYNFYGKDLGLCMPEEVALKILAIGLP